MKQMYNNNNDKVIKVKKSLTAKFKDEQL